MASNREAWLSLLPSDPRPELLASNEPFARFVTMTEVLGASEDDPEVRDTRRAMGNGEDLACAIATAFEHTAPGGVALFQPDFVAETFEPGTETGGSDAGGRGLRYLEWRWVPESSHESYVTDMAYLLRDEGGAVEALHDRHVMGLFSRAVWMEQIAAAGFEPLAVPFEHSSYSHTGHEVFLGRRPVRDEGA